jgi:methanogenic corrinoid protein MtbC1
MATPADPLAGLRRHYTDALLGGDLRSASGLVEDAAHSGTAVEDLYLDVLQPALHEVGERWERGEISVTQEHVATSVTTSVLAALAGRMTSRPRGRGHALVSGTPGERHVVGARMVADFLEAAGWEVEHLAEPQSAEAIASATLRSRARLVALSTSLPWLLPEARHACVALKALPSPPRVVVGGRAYRGDRHLAELVGADDFAADPRRLLAILDAEAAAAPG